MASAEGILLPKLHRWIVPIAHGSFGQSQVPFPNLRTTSRRTMGGILEMGRHKGMFFDELLATQQDYCTWVMNLQDPGPGFHKLIDWLKKKHSQEEAPPTPAATNTAGPAAKKFKSEECKICYDKVIDSVFVPCGHVAACITCADKLEACPICQMVCVLPN